MTTFDESTINNLFNEIAELRTLVNGLLTRDVSARDAAELVPELGDLEYRAVDDQGRLRMIMSAVNLLNEFGIPAHFMGFAEDGVTATIWIDADKGKLLAGGGVVRLDENGVSILTPSLFSGVYSYKFIDAIGLENGGLYAQRSSGANIIFLRHHDKDSQGLISIESDGTNEGIILLNAAADSADGSAELDLRADATFNTIISILRATGLSEIAELVLKVDNVSGKNQMIFNTIEMIFFGTAQFAEKTTAGVPVPGASFHALYPKDDGKWYSKNSSGVETPVGGGYNTVVDESGPPLTQRTVLNFTGAGVTASDNPTTGETDITIPGGSGGQITVNQNAPTANQIINSGYSVYVAKKYEVLPGVTTEIGATGILEIG